MSRALLVGLLLWLAMSAFALWRVWSEFDFDFR